MNVGVDRQVCRWLVAVPAGTARRQRPQAKGDRGPLPGVAECVFRPIPAPFRMAPKTPTWVFPPEEPEHKSAGPCRRAALSASKVSDAVSLGLDKSLAMRCRKKVSDALSVRTHLWDSH